MGPARRAGADRLAWAGTHRARHGCHRGAAGTTLARDLPRHPGPRPEPMEPAAGRRILPGLLRAAGRVAGGPTGHPADALAGHLDGRRHRPACRGRPSARAHRAAGAQRHRPAAGRGRGRAHPQLRRQPAGLCHDGRAGDLLPHRLQALWLAQRHAVAAAGRNLDAPPARRACHAALRPGDGAAVHPPPGRLRPVGSLGLPDPARAVPARRTQRPAAARCGRSHAHVRAARRGGHHRLAAATRRR
jgi:hypothetical protein